jgi:hypothetical protein
MALIDSLRAARDAVDKAIAGVGLRRTTVVINVEMWSLPVGTAGAAKSNTVPLTLTPSPRVRLLDEGDPSWYGGGLRSDANNDLSARVYQIGPITQTYFATSAGGYSASQLIAALTSPNNRNYITLSGDDFQVGGETFKTIHFDASHPLSVILYVQRTKQ